MAKCKRAINDEFIARLILRAKRACAVSDCENKCGGCNRVWGIPARNY